MSLNSSPSVRLNELFKIPDVANVKNSYRALCVKAADICVVVMKKQLSTDSFSAEGYENLRPFDETRCFMISTPYEIDDSKVEPHSLDTIGLLIYPTAEPNQLNKDLLWQEVAYVSDGIGTKLLKNQFFCSPELSDGFDYRHGAIVIRGHSKHVQGEVSALDELKSGFNTILVSVRADQPKIDPSIRTDLERAQHSLVQVQSFIKRDAYNPQKLEAAVNQKLEELFRMAENVSRLRLYEPNSKTDQEISGEQAKSSNFANRDLSPLVRDGYFNPIVTDQEVTSLEEGYLALGEVINQLKKVAFTDQQVAQRNSLQNAWSTKIREFEQIVSQNQITTAHRPIVRIYQDIPISTRADLKKGCWHLMAQLIDINDQSRYESYLNEPSYREQLLEVLEAEYAFYNSLDHSVIPRTMQLKVARRDIDELMQLDGFWRSFEKLGPNQFYLNSTDQVKKEIAQKFDKRLNENLGALNCFLRNPVEPGFRQALAARLDDVLQLLLQRIKLIDKKLDLAKQRAVSVDTIHYMDPYYSKKRAQFDSQFFTLAFSYIQGKMLAPTYRGPTDLMKSLALYGTSCLTKARTYGPLNETTSFKLCVKELCQYLNNQPIHTLEKIIKILSSIKNPIVAKLNALHEEFSNCITALDEVGDEMKDHLKKFTDDNWWQDFYNQKKIKTKLLAKLGL